MVVLETETAWRIPGGLDDWDLDRTSGRAVAVQTLRSGEAPTTQAGLTVIVNWFDELRRLTAGEGS